MEDVRNQKMHSWERTPSPFTAIGSPACTAPIWILWTS